MNSKQLRKGRRKFLRDAGPKLVQARLIGVPAYDIKHIKEYSFSMARLDFF